MILDTLNSYADKFDSIKTKSSQNNSRSQSKSKSKSNNDSMIINEPELLEKLSHFQDLYDFRREIFDRFNSSVQSVQPSDSLNSSIELTSDSDSDNSLIASTHRKKINLRKHHQSFIFLLSQIIKIQTNF